MLYQWKYGAICPKLSISRTIADRYPALRLYPTVPLNLRIATKTTTLPRGGGPDGQSPVLFTKGTGLAFSVYHLHRLESLYGSDSKVWRPERWESGELIKNVRLGVGFINFNAESTRIETWMLIWKIHSYYSRLVWMEILDSWLLISDFLTEESNSSRDCGIPIVYLQHLRTSFKGSH